MSSTSPAKAIREKCLECSCGSANEVRQCVITDCALYPFRFGKNPYIRRNVSEEQKQVFADRMKKARELKKAL